MKYMFLIFVFILISNDSFSQLFAEQKEIDLGDYGCLWISSKSNEIKELNRLRIKGRFAIDDTFIYNPEEFDVPSNYNIISQSLIRDDYGLFSFEMEIEKIRNDPFSDIIFYLCGYTLAGKDSICNIEFISMNINDIGIEDFQTNILIRSENHSIPYIRLANFNVLNNPAETSELVLNLKLWQDTDIIVSLFYYNNQLVKEERFFSISKNTKQLILNINDLTSGLYIIMMKTNHGIITKRFIVLK